MSKDLENSGLVDFPPGFGSVGTNRSIREAGHALVERTLDSNKIEVFPFEGTFFPWVQGPDGTWRAVCPDNEPPSGSKWGTLYELAKRARTRRPLKSDDRDLNLLRVVLAELLKAVQTIHQKTHDEGPGRLGLLDPTNVLYVVNSSGAPTLILPDAGFRWSGWLDTPRHLTELRWAGKPAECAIFQKLWGDQPLADAQRSATKTSETQALARLLGWVMSGQIYASAPTKHPSGTTSAELKAWKSLSPFLSAGDKSYSALDLARAYKEGPVWAAFLEKEWEPPQDTRRLAVVGFVLLLALLLGGAYYFREPLRDWIVGLLPKPEVRNSVCPECGESDPYFALLKDISHKDGAYHSLEGALTKGVVGNSVVNAWVLSDRKLEESQAQAVRTEQFEKVLTWIEAELATLKGMNSLEIEPTPAQVECRKRIVKQLHDAIENTARVMAWTNRLLSDLVQSEDRLRKIIKEFIVEAPELKLEQEWPKYVY